jgi:hypothetical protein
MDLKPINCYGRISIKPNAYLTVTNFIDSHDDASTIDSNRLSNVTGQDEHALPPFVHGGDPQLAVESTGYHSKVSANLRGPSRQD